MVGLDFLIA